MASWVGSVESDAALSSLRADYTSATDTVDIDKSNVRALFW